MGKFKNLEIEREEREMAQHGLPSSVVSSEYVHSLLMDEAKAVCRHCARGDIPAGPDDKGVFYHEKPSRWECNASTFWRLMVKIDLATYIEVKEK